MSGALGPSVGDMFVDPQKITTLLSGTGWEDVQVASVTEPAWMGANVDDVMNYIRGMPMIHNLAASLNDPVLREGILAAVAEEYGTRQHPDGI
jgi:hypothetical protein